MHILGTNLPGVFINGQKADVICAIIWLKCGLVMVR